MKNVKTTIKPRHATTDTGSKVNHQSAEGGLHVPHSPPIVNNFADARQASAIILPKSTQVGSGSAYQPPCFDDFS